MTLPPAAKPKNRRRKKNPPHPTSDSSSTTSGSNPSSLETESLDSAFDVDDGGGSSIATATTEEGGGEGEDAAPFEVVRSRKGGRFRKEKAAPASCGVVSSILSKDYAAGRGRKGNTVVEAAGVVSSLLSKDYAVEKDQRRAAAVEVSDAVSNEAKEQFLCSVLGEDSDLHLGIIRDVLCQFNYDVDKSLDYLLELSASSHRKDSGSCSSSETDRCEEFLLDQFSYADVVRGVMGNIQVGEKQMTFRVSGGECDGELDFFNYDCRNRSSPRASITKADMQRSVLESLFNIPKSSERNPNTMDWKKVVCKMELLRDPWKSGQDKVMDVGPIDEHGDGYEALREYSRQLWDTVKSYYQRATEAHSKGQRDFAAYLSEQGRIFYEKARKADEIASQRTFKVRNDKIQNIVTIDIHGQHVEEALDVLKIHLFSCSLMSSIRYLYVITGCGAQGVGKGKLKQAVIALLKNEGMEWKEENRGFISIKLDGRKEFKFLQVEL